MPLVLAANVTTESGLAYGDVLDERYEFPTSRYRRLIVPGETFVYYRGRLDRHRRRQPQVYLGTGVVGEVTPSLVADRSVCQVLDYTPFAEPLFFKRTDGTYYEPNGVRKGYFQPGVRRIDEDTFAEIVEAASVAVAAAELPAVYSPGPRATGDELIEVDELAVQYARQWLEAEFPTARIEEMPHHNPGWDITVWVGDRIRWFVEVKGTRSQEPRFNMSEGQRRFAERHAAQYLLLVVHAIELRSTNHAVAPHWGAVEKPKVRLEPQSWTGRLMDGSTRPS